MEKQNESTTVSDDAHQSEKRKEWEPMRLTFEGDAKDVVQMGPGKLSTPGGDPGESRKQGPAA